MVHEHFDVAENAEHEQGNSQVSLQAQDVEAWRVKFHELRLFTTLFIMAAQSSSRPCSPSATLKPCDLMVQQLISQAHARVKYQIWQSHASPGYCLRLGAEGWHQAGIAVPADAAADLSFSAAAVPALADDAADALSDSAVAAGHSDWECFLLQEPLLVHQ